MKRFFSLILVVVMLFTCSAVAESAVDFASMTDDQLHELINSARNELTKREMIMSEKTVLLEQDGVTVYFTGNHETWGYDSVYVDLEVVVVNDSDKSVSILIDSSSINGWEVFGTGVSDTGAGKKQKGVLSFEVTDAEISTYEEIEELELTITIYDGDAWETISVVEGIVVHCN